MQDKKEEEPAAAADLYALKAAVAGLTHKVKTLYSAVGTLREEKAELMGEVAEIHAKNNDLMGAVEELSADAADAAMAALIEDYFFVNQEEIPIAEMTEVILVPEFCVTGPSVFKFELAVNLVKDVEDIVVALMINSEVVAQAEADDFEAPSNLALIYRGAIEEQSDVKVILMARDEDQIDAKGLQYGYKLYGPEYNLIDAPGASCL